MEEQQIDIDELQMVIKVQNIMEIYIEIDEKIQMIMMNLIIIIIIFTII